MEGILAIIFIFGGGTLFLLAISPVGKALADRIRGGAPGAPDALREEVDALREELLAELQRQRAELSEIAERVDFMERLVAQQRDAARLAPPKVG